MKVSKDTLDAAIDYKASDSVVMDVRERDHPFIITPTRIQGYGSYGLPDPAGQPSNIVIATYSKDPRRERSSGSRWCRRKYHAIRQDQVQYQDRRKGYTSDTIPSPMKCISCETMKKMAPRTISSFMGGSRPVTWTRPISPSWPRNEGHTRRWPLRADSTRNSRGCRTHLHTFRLLPYLQRPSFRSVLPSFTTSDQFGVGLEGLDITRC